MFDPWNKQIALIVLIDTFTKRQPLQHETKEARVNEWLFIVIFDIVVVSGVTSFQWNNGKVLGSNLRRSLEYFYEDTTWSNSFCFRDILHQRVSVSFERSLPIFNINF